MQYQDKTIWIIGASEGIGAALASELAQAGAKLILSARDEKKLLGLSISETHIIPVDVAKKAEFKKVIKQVFNDYNVDMLLYLPGFYEPSRIEALTDRNIDQSIAINYRSVFTLIQSVVPYMDHLHLVVFASVAGYCGLPNSQPYASTKAAVIHLMESMKAEHPEWQITLVNPGFVKTRLTDKNQFKMPALQTPEQAAKAIANKLKKRPFEIHFPGRFTYPLKCLALLPYRLFFSAIKRLT